MRWIFWCLLAFNVLYFAWAGLHPAESGSAGVALAEDASIPRLQLLSEAGIQPRVAEATTEMPDAGTTAAVTAPVTAVADMALPLSAGTVQQCFTLGPLTRDGDVAAISSRLASAGLKAARRDLAISASDSWVYLPAFTTRDIAAKRVQELKDKGIDSFVVADGEFRNAVSLGHFSRPDSAAAFLDSMKKAGYPAEIRQLPVSSKELWLDVTLSDQGHQSGVVVEKLLQAYPGLRRVQAACS